MLQRETLKRLWPHCPPALIDGMVASSAAVFAKYGIDSQDVVAIIMAQGSHECGAGTEIVENLSYSAARIPQVWPSRFPSVAAAMPYAHNPKKLADKVYNGRMGNRPDSDDGYNFRGRGFTNCTGQEGYAKLGARMGLDLINNPDLVNDPRYFLEAGVADFVLCGCLEPARRGDFRMVTRRLNGGYIGLAERQQWLKKWQSALAAEHGGEAMVPLPPPRPPGTLSQGSVGPDVKALQQQLSDKGYACGADDGEFHEATRDAVNSFKADNGLPTDGTVDHQTKAALSTAPDRPIGEGRATATADDLREKGSVTVAKADSSSLVAKIGGATAVVTGAQQTGILDKVKDLSDQAQSVKAIIDPLQDTIHWLMENWWIGALVACAAVIYFNRGVIAARLADHRSGANLGR